VCVYVRVCVCVCVLSLGPQNGRLQVSMVCCAMFLCCYKGLYVGLCCACIVYVGVYMCLLYFYHIIIHYFGLFCVCEVGLFSVT